MIGRLSVSVRRTFSIVRKEFRHIVRDPRTFFMVVFSPAALLFVLAYLFSFEVENISLAFLDQDKTALSRQFIATFTSDADFVVRAYLDGYADMDPLLLTGAVDAVLVIPPGFGDSILRGEPAPVQAVLDAVDPIVGSQVMSSINLHTVDFATHIRGSTPRWSVVAPPLEVRSQAWYNSRLKSEISMVPGLIPIVLCLPAMAVALAVTREKEMGSLEALMASPVSGVEYLLGKLMAYVLTGLASVILAWVVACGWFGVPFRGNVIEFVLLTAVFLVAGMSISLLIANFVSSQQAATTIVLFVFFVPGFFLSALILPLDGKSLGSRLVSYALPATHFVEICRAVFLKGVGLREVWVPALVLLGMGVVSLVSSILLFKKKLA